MIRKLFASLFVLMSLIAYPVHAQDDGETVELRLTRDFGYGGIGTIQGTFSLKVGNGENFEKVEFLLNGDVISIDTEAPFRYQFNTSAYPLGENSMSAIGYKSDGSQVHSREIVREFVSAENAWSTIGDIAVPLLIGIGVIAVIGTLGTTLLGRKKTHKPGEYGLAGGAVCPNCSLPYARSILAPNLLVGKLSRCPHCGKWRIVARASKGNLEAAENKLLDKGGIEIESTKTDDSLRKMLDDSRFEN